MNKSTHALIQRLSTIFLFFLLAVCVMAVIAAGAGVWRVTADGLNETFSTRTAAAYVTQKVRQSDAAGAVSLTRWEDLQALCLREDERATYLYYFDGALREVTLPDGVTVPPDAGQPVVLLESAGFESLGGGLYRFSAQSDGDRETVLFTLLCEEVAP